MHHEIALSLVDVLRSLDRSLEDTTKLVDGLSDDARQELLNCALANLMRHTFRDFDAPVTLHHAELGPRRELRLAAE